MNPTDLLSELIAHPSVSDRSNEAITTLVSDRLGQIGFDCQVDRYLDPAGVAKFNLVAHRPAASVAAFRQDAESSPADLLSGSADRRPGGTPLPQREDRRPGGTPLPEGEDRRPGGTPLPSARTSGLAYFAHTDVVPAIAWTGPGGDPFAAVQLDNKIYGRGACDMKGSLAAMIVAVSQIDAADQTAPLWIVCTADEETGLHGARRLAASDCFKPIVAADPLAIIGEPTELSVVHAHKGFGGFKLIAHGAAAHSSTGRGDNAVAKMLPVLAAVEQINARVASDSSLTNDSFDPPTMTFNYGIHDRCTATNIVPEHCEIWASYRIMPGVDYSWIETEIRGLAERHELELQIKRTAMPMITPADSDDVAELFQLSQSIGGSTVRVTTAPYATDAAELTGLSRRIVCGPGNIAQAHTAAEFIEVDQLDAGVSLYRAAVKRWCC